MTQVDLLGSLLDGWVNGNKPGLRDSIAQSKEVFASKHDQTNSYC
jgi:hypothetical protein